MDEQRRMGKVMVVDDDEVVLEVTRERLSAAGYDVVVRLSAIGTMVAILREKPDFVLLDVRMPGLGGDALARLLKTSDPKWRPGIILHSSASKEYLAELAERCGAIGFIEKTASPHAFLRQFATCVHARVMSMRTTRPAD